CFSIAIFCCGGAGAPGLLADALSNRRSLSYSIARVENNTISFIQPCENLGSSAIAVFNLDDRRARAAVLESEHCPIVPLPEESANRDTEHLFSFPHRDMNDDAVVVSKPRPRIGRISEVDCCADSLFFNPKRRYLQKSSRVDPRYAPLNRWS